MSIEELEAEIKKLTLKDHTALAKCVIESLDQLSAPEIEPLWAEEAERRLDELELGLVPERPAEDVLRRARAAAHCRGSAGHDAGASACRLTLRSTGPLARIRSPRSVSVSVSRQGRDW